MDQQKTANSPQSRHRLILIEGIPGSGKTTLSARLDEWLREQGIQTVLYREGDAHPADMAWNALLTPDEFEQTKRAHPHLAEQMTALAREEDGRYVVAYTKMSYGEMGPALVSFFEAHEVYDGRVPLEVFGSLHRRRWNDFARMAMETPDTVYLFECSFLQNHVNELMGAHMKAADEILTYLNELTAPVRPLNPLLLYLDQSSTDETIRRVAAERVSPADSDRPDWIQLVIEYVEKSPYAKQHELKGYEGALRFIRERKKIEMAVWPGLLMDRVLIPNPDYDWDAVFARMTQAVQ